MGVLEEKTLLFGVETGKPEALKTDEPDKHIMCLQV